VAVALTIIAVPLVGSVLYLLALAVASVFHRPPAAPNAPRTRLLVLIPAHNEAGQIAACVGSVRAQRYPQDRVQVVVIADNCQDQTAVAARSAGAVAMVRDEPAAPGKGRALRWALDRLLRGGAAFDAVVMVDADSVADPDLLIGLERELVAGHQVVQAACIVRSATPREALQAVAVLLRLDVRYAGRAVLGMPAVLSGNGMLFARRVLEQHPWDAFTAVEDAEYSLRLRLAGIKVAYARGARVYAPPTTSERGATSQGLRWEGGRVALMRAWLAPIVSTMLRERDWGLLETVIDLAVPPLGVLTVAAYVGTAIVALLYLAAVIPAWTLLPWVFSAIALPTYVLLGLRSAGAPASMYVALLWGPRFLVRKLAIYARLVRGFDADQWVRTERPHESRAR
jgi:cellulose synthase/poly-beta-1,6-N-acetylglucosamine synthase-like glycosyltransferase